jgi:hypothetical protein
MKVTSTVQEAATKKQALKNQKEKKYDLQDQYKKDA